MKTIKKIYNAQQINMGGIILDQALPIEDIDYVDPFLLIHHWKQTYKGGEKQSDLGVGPHPHRGFAPVTLIFDGAVFHQDSIGNKSLVKKGGTQWMNSGKGIIHSERPSKTLAEKGGTFEIIQFWVNIPSKNKSDAPDYQPLESYQMPVIISDGGLVKTGIVAGNFMGTKGKLNTYTELTILRFEISKGGKISVPVAKGFNTLFYQLDGKLTINDSTLTNAKQLIQFDTNGDEFQIEGIEDTRAILLAGKPIKEEVAFYGPFVMNTKQEIYDAVQDYNSGKMGKLTEDFVEFYVQSN